VRAVPVVSPLLRGAVRQEQSPGFARRRERQHHGLHGHPHPARWGGASPFQPQQLYCARAENSGARFRPRPVVSATRSWLASRSKYSRPNSSIHSFVLRPGAAPIQFHTAGKFICPSLAPKPAHDLFIGNAGCFDAGEFADLTLKSSSEKSFTFPGSARFLPARLCRSRFCLSKCLFPIGFRRFPAPAAAFPPGRLRRYGPGDSFPIFGSV